jgi:hypothetical protein
MLSLLECSTLPFDCSCMHLIKVLILVIIFFEKHCTNIDTYTCTSTHSYKHMHAHPIPMNIFERLG